MIPKIIHQIWVGTFKIPMREKELSEKVKVLHEDYEYKFWTSINEIEDEMSEGQKTVYKMLYDRKHYTFCADLLRVFVVQKYGGFYFDVDFEIKTRMDNFLNYDGMFIYNNEDQTDYNIGNGVFASKKDCPILKHCLNKIEVNPHHSNYWFGPSWFGTYVKDFFNLSYKEENIKIIEEMKKHNVLYFPATDWYRDYATHYSLYSWSPEVWSRLNSGEQL